MKYNISKNPFTFYLSTSSGHPRQSRRLSETASTMRNPEHWGSFKGTLGKCPGFLQQFAQVFLLYPQMPEKSKILYIVGLLQGGALAWAQAVNSHNPLVYLPVSESGSPTVVLPCFFPQSTEEFPTWTWKGLVHTLCRCSCTATWLCRSVNAFPGCIFLSANMCWTVSEASLHSLHLGSCLVW